MAFYDHIRDEQRLITPDAAHFAINMIIMTVLPRSEGTCQQKSLFFCRPCIWLSTLIVFRLQISTDNSTNITFQLPNITKPFCQNVNLNEAEMLAYRYTLVLVQYIIPVCVISFVYIQVWRMSFFFVMESTSDSELFLRWQLSFGDQKLPEMPKTCATSTCWRTRRKS